MAKRPYVKASKTVAKRNKRPTLNCKVGEPIIINSNNLSFANEQETLNQIEQIANRSLSRTITDPAECISGGCPPVYIPVILQFYNTSLESSDPTEEDLSPHSGYYSTNFSLLEKYNWITNSFEKLNKALSGEELEDYEFKINVAHATTGAEHYTNHSIGGLLQKSVINPRDFKYPTGSQIYDDNEYLSDGITDNPTYGELIDEYASYVDQGDHLPNVRFFFPKRLRAEYFLDQPLFPVDTGCGVSIREVLEYIDQVPTGGVLAQILTTDEFIYFDSNYPGVVTWDGEETNGEFFTKLNHLQKVIKGNDLPMDIYKKVIGNTYHTWNEAYLGVTWKHFYNHQQPTVFNNIAYNFHASIFGIQEVWKSNTNLYDNNSLYGSIHVSASTLLHEWGHAHGFNHPWTAPVLGGKGATTTRVHKESGFNSSSHLGWESTKVTQATSTVGNVFNYPLKPPFIYEEYNYKYPLRQRDSDKADVDYDYWVEYQTNNSSRDLNDVVENYLERKNHLNQKLAETEEYITHDFFNISDEEKGYIEFIFNRAIPEYTDGFTMKYTFTSALENSDNKASISLNKIPSLAAAGETNDDGTTSDASSLFIKLVHSVYTGIQSFWGGSIVFNDPALMPTVETVGESAVPQIGDEYEGGLLFYIDEEAGTGLVAAMEDVGKFGWGCTGTTISGADGQAIGTGYQNTLDIVAGCSETPIPASEALAYEAEGYSDWYLPSKHELLEMYNTIGQGSENGNIGGFENLFYWSSSESSSNGARYVNFNTGWASSYYKSNKGKVRAVRSVNLAEPAPVGPSPYETAFLEAILANPNAPTSLVVNPEDYSGYRRGPDVTTRIPFCTQANGVPSKTDLSLNTKFDVHWAHNFNAYNPAYPEYPANTKVEDLLNAEYCPCLRTLQTYYSEGEAYEYTIISPESSAWALHRLYETHVSNEPQANDPDLTDAENLALSKPFGERTTGWEGIFVEEGVYEDSPSSIQERADFYSIQWLIHTTTNFNTSQTNSELHLHEYPNGEKLSLPTFSGYCGVGGYSTVVPNVLKVDTKAAYESVSDLPYEESKAMYLSNQIDVPNDYFLGRGFSTLNTNLRIKSEVTGANLSSGSHSSQGSSGTVDYILAYTDNAEVRYAIGKSDSSHPLYNPLRKYYTQTTDYNDDVASYEDGTVYVNSSYGYGGSLTEGSFPLYSITGEFTNTFDFYTDMYGEYNPLYMNDVMNYEGTGVNIQKALLPVNTVRGLNWYYNDSNNAIPTIYKSVYEDDTEAESTGMYNRFETVITYFTTKVKAHYVGDLIGGCMDSVEGYNYNPLATYDNGSCIDRVYGCTQEWADNYDELANTEDGSCQVELCIDSSAAAGYDASLVSAVQSYGGTYSTTAYTAAGEEIVDSLISSNTSLCQFLIEPRPALIRMICGDEAVSGNPSILSCNYNPSISYIRDADDFNITAHTSNPEVITESYEDFRVSNNISYLEVRSLPLFTLESGGEFPSILTYYDQLQTLNGDSLSADRVIYDVLGNVGAVESMNALNSIYLYKYNCVENPILPDGSGGCYLYEHNFSECIFTEVSSQTYNDCNNVVLFEGGELVDASWFEGYDLIAQTSNCPEDIPQYVIGGDWAVQYGEAAVANGIKIPSTSLPVYSEHQINETTGYPMEILNASQIPQGYRSRGTKREDPVEPEISTSNAFTVLTSILLYTSNGTPYTGEFKFTLNVETDVKVYYSYNSEIGELTDILYFRTEVLRLPNVILTPQEEYVKKMHKVINKIINLTTFTTN